MGHYYLWDAYYVLQCRCQLYNSQRDEDTNNYADASFAIN